jgi:hypothetical protein
MLRSREGAQSKKFRLAAAIAFSYDYGHMFCAPAQLVTFSALFAAVLAQPTDAPSDHERGQQERDDHAYADEHIGENYSGAALDGHDARMRVASMPQYGQSSGSPRGFMI